MVIETGDAFDFKSGEVLVRDAVDPNVTFVVRLATAIVERRGGMLIYGDIIVREYGLPSPPVTRSRWTASWAY